MIHAVNDFFNQIAPVIKDKYFPDVIHGRTENANYYKSVYTMECFHNGCLTYRKLIGRLARACNESTEAIHAIVSKYIISFGSYEYKPKKATTN